MTNVNPHWARRFFTLWTGQALSLLGSQLVQFAIIWHLTKTTNSATTLAIASMMGLLPQVLLSPFIGTSHFVWTAQIAVTLVALACGYYVGGKLADRSQKLGGLYWAIIAAAAYLILTVLIWKLVSYVLF